MEVLRLALSACQAASPAATAAPASTEAPAAMEILPETGGEATINVAANPDSGEILVDGNGMTLYMIT